MLKHDEQGFLTGEGGMSRNDAAAKFMQVWADIAQGVRATVRNTEAIRADLHAMRAAFQARDTGMMLPPPADPVAPTQHSSTPLALPKGREETGTHRENTQNAPVATPEGRKEPAAEPARPEAAQQQTTAQPAAQGAMPDTPSAPPELPATPTQATAEKPARKATNPDQARGENGRYVKRDAEIVTPTARGEDPAQKSSGVLAGAMGRLAEAVNETAQGTEQADPAVQAMREIATPVARGWELLSGGDGEKRQEGWLKRIFSRLGNMREDATKTGKETNKKLTEIEKKPTDKSGSDSGGLLAAIAAIVPMILALLTKIPVIGPLLSMGGKLVSSVGGALAGAGAGVLKKIPVLGKMLGGGAAATGEAAAGGAAAGAGTAAEKAAGASKLANFGKGILKKIPIIGGLLAGAGAASDIYDSETSDASRRDKDKNAGKAVGGLGGTIAGGMAGAKIGALAGTVFGPIGTAIGGVIGAGLGAFLGDQAGQIIGNKVGEWTNELRSADIVGTITRAWDSVVSGFKSTYESIKSTWGGFVDSAKSGWDTIANLFKAAYEGLKSIPVIGPAIQAAENAAKKTAAVASAATETAKAKAVEVGTNAVEKGKEVAQATKEKAVEVGTKAAVVGGKAVDATVQAAGKAGEAVKQGAEWAGKNTTIGKGAVAAYQGVKSAGEWVLGQTSKRFESGKGGAATVSSGKGDLGGASYGTYQLSSKMGKVQDFLKTSKYGEQFSGLQPGTPEFNSKWKEVAKADPEFGVAQHDYIKKTNFDPAMAGLGKAGFNTSNMSQAMQDAVWSTSVQFGAGSEKKGNGAIGMFKKAFAGKDYNSMSDEERIKTLQDYKLANNDKLFASSSADVKAGTAKRAADEKKSLLAMAGQGAGQSKSASPATTADAPTAKSASASPTTIPKADVVASAPPVTPKADVVASAPPVTPKADIASAPPVTPKADVVASAPPATPKADVVASAPPATPKVAAQQTVVVHAPIPSAPKTPAMSVPDYKPPQVDASVSVANNAQQGAGGGSDVSQHVSNQAIAHIVTGGIGMRGA